MVKDPLFRIQGDLLSPKCNLYALFLFIYLNLASCSLDTLATEHTHYLNVSRFSPIKVLAPPTFILLHMYCKTLVTNAENKPGCKYFWSQE